MASGFSLAYRFSSIAFCWSVSDDLRKVCVNVGTTSRTMGSFFAKYLAISFAPSKNSESLLLNTPTAQCFMRALYSRVFALK